MSKKKNYDRKEKTSDVVMETSFEKPTTDLESATITKEEKSDNKKKYGNNSSIAVTTTSGNVSSSSIPLAINRAAGRINYSGGSSLTQGDDSATVRGVQPARSGDRPGRREDNALQYIDDVPCEIVIPNITTIPNLRDGDSAVGYNGNYVNSHYTTQKGSGSTPGDRQFMRTFDEVVVDNLYFVDGQFNHANTTDRTLPLPVDKRVVDANETSYVPVDTPVTLGNYLTRNVVVTFDRTDGNNDVSLEFEVEDITPDPQHEFVSRVAGDSVLRNRNQNELDRLEMISVAGDETKPNWSPLGKTIKGSSDFNMFTRMYESTIGSIMFTSMAKLNSALSYQINKTAKDGLRRNGPIGEMLDGFLDGMGDVESISDDEASNDKVFSFSKKTGEDYVEASSALFIALMDTTAKYTTKGKVLALPLSFKNALSIAEKNINTMYINDLFKKTFDSEEMFSTLRDANTGMDTTFITDGSGLVHNLSLDELSNMTEDHVFGYVQFGDLRNVYRVPIRNYFEAGLIRWLKRHSSKFFEKCAKKTDKTLTLKIPTISRTKQITLWDLIICASSSDIAYEKTISNTLIDDYIEKNGKYPYTGYQKIDTSNYMDRQLFSSNGPSNPLRAGVLNDKMTFRMMLPEIFSPVASIGDDGGAALVDRKSMVLKTILPWYFSQNAFTGVEGTTGKVWALDMDGLSNMTTFDLRGGATMDLLQTAHTIGFEKIRLFMDRMVIPPAMGKQAGDHKKFTSDAFKYSSLDDGIPMFNYYAFADDEDDVQYRLTVRDVLKTPRELGLSMIAPAGLITNSLKFDGTAESPSYIPNKVKLDSSYFKFSGSSFRMYQWSSTQCPIEGSNSTFLSSINTTMSASLKAVYKVIHACGQSGLKSPLSNREQVLTPFITENSAAKFNYSGDAQGTFESNETPVNSDALAFRSVVSNFWVRLHILPFLINPFEQISFYDYTAHGKNDWEKVVEVLPYDFMHIFNLCGFRAGDYKNTEYLRIKARIESGLNYVSDPYIENSL